MTAAELKASILDRAVHGLLVPQRDEERFEKFEGFERFEKSTIDNPPYELPRGWAWKRLGEVIELKSGQDLKPSEYNDKQEGIPYITGASNICNGEIAINRWTRFGRSFAIRGDLLLSCKGTVGAMAFLSEDKVHIARQIMGIRVSNACNDWYVRYFIETSVSELQRNAKSLIPGIARNDLLGLPFPLPPLAEQKRIVAKIEELMPLVEEYGKAETELAALNDNFPTALRKSILQHAVEGRLTAAWRKANPRGETAAELLAKIAAEKKHLLAEGKIKKQKPLPPITDDEKPFPIPDTWAWVRFCSLVDEISTGPFGSMLHKKDYVPSGIPIVNPANIVNEAIVPSDKMMVSEETRDRLSSYRLEDGMIVMARRGEMGRCAMVSRKEDGWLCGTGSFFMRLLGEVDGHYLIKFFATPHAKKVLGGESVGTTMSNLNHGILNSIPIPLPPLAEQKAIVERVEELLGLVEKMKE